MELSIKDSTKESLKRNGMNILISILISLIIIIICSYFQKDFFFWDDAQNEVLPFYRAIGKIWLDGEIPFIVKDSFLGQNQMIDMQRAIFLPQNILVSILSTKIQSLIIVSKVLVFINMVLITFFSQKIIEALSINKKYKPIISFLFIINPIFLYIFLPSWWNSASAQVWFIGALASILLLRKDFKIKYLILNVFTVLCILADGFPQSVIAYFFVALVYLFEMLYNKKYKEMAIFILMSLGIVLIGLNVYSEYIISSNMTRRHSAIDNNGNFLKPLLDQILITFSPVYYGFMNRFGGYIFTGISIGYSSIYILIFICFTKNFKNIFKNNNIKFLSKLLLVFFILVQMPEQMGPVRHPFRLLPYFTEILVIFSIYGISIGELEFSKLRIKTFLTILIITSLLSIFNVETDYIKIIILNILFLISTGIYVFIVAKYKEVNIKYSILYSITLLLLMLSMETSPLFFLSHQKLNDKINTENINNKGYLLSLANMGGDEEGNKTPESLYSAQFLLYGIKSINGYSPVGNKFLFELIDSESADRNINDERTIQNLSQKYRDKCYFDLLNINLIILRKDRILEKPEMKKSIKNCGYTETESKLDATVNYIKNSNNIGNISYTSNGITINKQLENKANKEKYQLSSFSDGIIVLSKVYWRGYRAYINGKKVNISNEKGLLKLENIPKGLNNAILEIKFFPRSWRITLWLGLLGILDIIIVLFYIKRQEIKERGVKIDE